MACHDDDFMDPVDWIPAFPRGIYGTEITRGELMTFRMNDFESSSQDFSDDVKGKPQLRFFLASEYHGEGSVVAQNLRTDRIVGQCEISYGYALQPFYLDIVHLDAVVDRELFLTLVIGSGQEPENSTQGCLEQRVWIVHDDEFGGSFVPSLTSGGQDKGTFDHLIRCLFSPWGLQPFNWISGCVFDGLSDYIRVTEREDLQRLMYGLLEHYFREDGKLVYTGPMSEYRCNELFGIESLLSFAPLFRYGIEHPSIGIFDSFCRENLGEDGLIIDRTSDAEGRFLSDFFVSVEGCYTIAYPLSLRADLLGDSSLLRIAMDQIRLRLPYILKEDVIYQKSSSTGLFYQPDWARAIGWFLLGTAKTLLIVSDVLDCTDILNAFTAVAHRAMRFQKDDGLYSVYIDEIRLHADTSGSAGIATAFALGFQAGFLGAEFLASAEKTRIGLEGRIVKDGFIGSASQLNRGGPDFQRRPFRVFGQYTSGLTLQLLAALKSIDRYVQEEEKRT